MSPRPVYLATGYVRAAGLLTLLIGIAVMHVFIAPHASAHTAAPTAAQPIAHHAMPTDMAGHTAMPMPAISPEPAEHTSAHSAMRMPDGPMDPGCAGNCCAMGAGMHACVFILTALVLLAGLALLCRVEQTDAAGRPRRGWAVRHARPPPWTMPTLTELSILRI